MTNNEFTNEFEYQATKKIMVDLLSKNIIDKSEFNSIMNDLKEKYKPAFDLLT